MDLPFLPCMSLLLSTCFWNWSLGYLIAASSVSLCILSSHLKDICFPQFFQAVSGTGLSAIYLIPASLCSLCILSSHLKNICFPQLFQVVSGTGASVARYHLHVLSVEVRILPEAVGWNQGQSSVGHVPCHSCCYPLLTDKEQSSYTGILSNGRDKKNFWLCQYFVKCLLKVM